MNFRRPDPWLELSGRLGPPIFAASLVGCLLMGHMEGRHLVLIGLGIALISIDLVWHDRG